jgi:hypothetical protein
MTIEQLLDLVMTSRLRELHTALPCRVESYNASKQTADVLPMIKRQVPDGDGGYTLEDLPVLPNVPVAFPRGGGGFFMSFPLQKGDFVFVVFSERAIGAGTIDRRMAATPGRLRLQPGHRRGNRRPSKQPHSESLPYRARKPDQRLAPRPADPSDGTPAPRGGRL